MQEEISALQNNQTWKLVPRTETMNVIGCKWVYKSKLKAYGSLERLKARLVAKGFNQIPRIDFLETFSPVVKPATIRVICPLLCLTSGTSDNLTLRMPSYMAILTNLSIWNNHLGS